LTPPVSAPKSLKQLDIFELATRIEPAKAFGRDF
jgi:hypothetical protein